MYCTLQGRGFCIIFKQQSEHQLHRGVGLVWCTYDWEESGDCSSFRELNQVSPPYLPRALTMVQQISRNWEFSLLRNCATLTFNPWALSLTFSALACRQTLAFKICHFQLLSHHLQFFIKQTYSTQQESSNSTILFKICIFPQIIRYLRYWRYHHTPGSVLC